MLSKFHMQTNNDYRHIKRNEIPLTETMPRVGSRTPTEAPGATTDGGGHGRSPSLLTPEKTYPDENTN